MNAISRRDKQNTHFKKIHLPCLFYTVCMQYNEMNTAPVFMHAHCTGFCKDKQEPETYARATGHITRTYSVHVINCQQS